jgi:hypothetical protein
MSKRVAKHTRLSLVAACAMAMLLFGYGCTSSLNHIGAFSQATADLSKQAAAAYAEVNATTIERRINDIAAETGAFPDDATFEALIGGADLRTRIALLEGIEAYARALSGLSSADFRKEIDAASKDLYGALGQLQSTYTAIAREPSPLTSDHFAAIATAVDAIGTRLAEERRREALRTVVIQANPVVQTSMKLFEEEISMLSGFILSNLDTIYTEKIKAYQRESKTLSFNSRVSRLRDVRLSYERMTTTQSLLEKLTKASSKIAEAHQTLYETVLRNQFTSKQLVLAIREVADLAQTIKAFNDKLKRS